ncbi:hypothetical protein AVEN_165553-1, partial [Araneus ventricosus]
YREDAPLWVYAWALSVSPRLEQNWPQYRGSYSYITGSYRTTPTEALQTITGIMPLRLKAQQEAIYINVTCLRKEKEFEGISHQSKDYEEKIKSLNVGKQRNNRVRIKTRESIFLL